MIANTDKVKRYTTLKYSLAIADLITLLLFLSLVQYLGISVWLRDVAVAALKYPWAATLLYSLAAILIYSIFNFPLAFYRSYAVEHQFDLSKQSIGSWLADYLKSTLISTIIFAILIEAFAYFLRAHPAQWWWMCSIFWIFLSVVLARIFPVVIIPLFFKYTKIENEDLRSCILALADKMKVKVLDVFRIDFSKKTVKANAGLVGLGKTKRVILADTLEGRFSAEEIEVILAHEFAHQRLQHLAKILVINAVTIVAAFYLIFRFGQVIFDSFGLAMPDIAGLPIWLFLFVIYQIILTPLLNWMVRVMETNADSMALDVTARPREFISMIEKLTEQNLSERKPPLWIKIFFYDHPPTDERVLAAQKRM